MCSIIIGTHLTLLMEENPDEPPFQITSQPCSLEAFYEKHDFPQMVCAAGGYFGVRPEDTISVGQELLLFFVKTSQVIVASKLSNTSRSAAAQQYYIPLNSLLWFVPHEYISKGDDSSHCQDYKTVGDLLKRKGVLPKVVKVCKTYTGKSAQSSVMAGELIFPQKVQKRNKVLECLSSKNELLLLEVSCEGNFSIRPKDIKMHIADFIHHFNDFPMSVMVINDQTITKASVSLSTGTILSLNESKSLQSYIYSTDIFGKKNYPLIEMPMSIPIQIQCIKYANLDVKPIYHAIQHAFENFKPSMVKQKILHTQNRLYEEVQKDDGTAHIYDLERPSRIYERIPGKVEGTKDASTCPTHKLVEKSPSYTEKSQFQSPLNRFPIPPKSPKKISNSHAVLSTGITKSIPSAPPLPVRFAYTNLRGGKKPPVAIKQSTEVSTYDDVIATKPYHFKSSSGPSSNFTTAYSSKEDNVAYLKEFSLNNVLQLLDNMNLGEHKKSFEDEQIDGEIIVLLGRADLIDLGVTKSIHQTRLLKLIDGSVSAKKYHQHGTTITP